jgi:hypothetical protein
VLPRIRNPVSAQQQVHPRNGRQANRKTERPRVVGPNTVVHMYN